MKTSSVDTEASAPAHARKESWGERQRAESAAIVARRKIAFPQPEDGRHCAPKVGLALSGGGIRSATFCLGLLRGLAQNGLLRRFDYLSTVSGGGSAGAVFGRMAAALGIDRTEKALKRGDSLVLTWLRRNGRYLTPAGARDFGIVIATYLRASVAVQMELGFFSLLIGLLVVLPHLVSAEFPILDAALWAPWQTIWWPIATALWLLLAPAVMVVYWPLRLRAAAVEAATLKQVPWARGLIWMALSFGLVAFASWWTLVKDLAERPLQALLGLPPVALIISLLAVGTFFRLLSTLQRLATTSNDVAEDAFACERNRLTRLLRLFNKWTFALFLLGVLDWVTFQLSDRDIGEWLLGGLGTGTVVAIIVRSFGDSMQKRATSPDGSQSRWLPRLINIVGISVGLVVMGSWIVLLQWFVFGRFFWPPADGLSPALRAIVVASIVIGWLVLTARNCETVNATTLHSFYRARLTRAYLSVGNRRRFPQEVDAVSASRDIESDVVSVTDVLSGDDVPLWNYQPEQHGGPIHLVCCCLNQTVDDSSELYNADRKGMAIVASSRGIEVGLESSCLVPTNTRLGSLGQWIAVSGAAAAPGAGSNTTTGWALLLFLVGARLGLWRESDADDAARPAGLRERLLETKPGLLISEATAWFAGRQRKWWFLSDGGHFDNTGVYPLLRRELDCIVLADCGADPKFEFADVENLIRKARIDFDADIEFYTREEAARFMTGGETDLRILAPEDMANNRSVRGVLLARICYHRSQPPEHWKIGSLVIVKPNLHEALDRDVLAYAHRNPSFPQQSTGDLFFDEAQWESYQRLGEDFGRSMTRTWFNRVPGWRVGIERPDRIVPLRPTRVKAEDVDDAPWWRKGVAVTALGTGLGLGAIGALLLPAWQVLDGINTQRAAEAKRQADEIRDVIVLMDKVGEPMRKAVAGNVIPAPAPAPASSPIAPSPTPVPSSAAAATPLDVDPATAFSLRTIFDKTKTYPQDDPGLDSARAFIREAQAVCAPTDDGECTRSSATVPRLCEAVCDSRPDEPAYWRTDMTKFANWPTNSHAVYVVSAVKWLLSLPEALHLDWNPFGQAHRHASNGPDLPPSSRPGPSAASPAPGTSEAPSPPSSPPPSEPAAGSVISAGQGDAASGSTAATHWLKQCGFLNEPTILYTQIYAEGLREPLRAINEKLQLDAEIEKLPHAKSQRAIQVAGIENVVSTAIAQRRKAPALWPTPTLVVHGSESADLACAEALAATLKPHFDPLYPQPEQARIAIRQIRMPKGGRPHVIELWMPPAGTVNR